MRGTGFLTRPISPDLAEAKLRAAQNKRALDDAHAGYVAHFPAGSAVREHLDAIYGDRAAQFAVEAVRYLGAG